ncbi:hypothetical protein FHL15_011118 [Xylaria flabelliformis]|uniref:DUF3328 domain-containing protein n=1 Tax=Xylaria flabelliformis TaxID=2512241 RepID=A0A553HJ44_9PEZI|nr:hypothetical protein FHL15_011118 [Xylaria flabelliformis]
MLSDDSISHSSESLGLLTATESSKSKGEQLEPVHRQVGSTKSGYPWLALIILLLASLLYNVLQAVQASRGDNCVSLIGGLRTDQHDSFTEESMWSDTSNMTALDKLWSDMDVNPGIIQLPKDARLGSTQTFPWDQSKGLYMLDSYHSLHCLKNIYAYVRMRQRDDSGGPTAGHIFHCLADIRLSVLCEADDTVLPFLGKTKVEVPAPKRMCRSWKRLEGYANKNSACFQRREDDDPLHDSLFEYMNCPASSPYYNLVQDLRKLNDA